MRTKTLLLTAALSAAGIATSMAQGAVFSVNAVGYVNTVVPPGFSMISNPLKATSNTIADLFKGVPFGTQVYLFSNTAGFKIYTNDEDAGGFEAGASTDTLLPGDGVFIRNSGTAPFTVTFVGEVMQGNLHNALPAGLSIKSSQVPLAGTAEDLKLVGGPGDQIYQFSNTTGYYIATFDEDAGGWDKPLHSLAVGESFFLRKAVAGNWDRTFTVNQ